MKKIITFTVIACMITGCGALKRDEIVKADTPDNTSGTSINSPKDPERNKKENSQDSKYTTTEYILSGIAVIAATIFIMKICHSCWDEIQQYNKKPT